MASRRAEKRRALRRQCRNKIKYETTAEAQAHCNALFLKRGERLHVYRCEVCKALHVGHWSRRQS